MITTILLVDNTLLHTGVPIDSIETNELIYEDIIYPKNVILGYSFITWDLPEDVNIADYKYVDGVIILRGV